MTPIYYKTFDEGEPPLNKEIILRNIETKAHFIVWYSEKTKELLKCIASQYEWLDENK